MIVNKTMRLWLWGTVLFLAGASTAWADVKDANVTSRQSLNIFGRTLTFSLPLGWKLAHDEEFGGTYSAEFVPETEALARWSTLFCVQGFKDMGKNIAPEAFLDGYAKTYGQSCQGEVIYQKLGPVSIDGQAGFHALLGCTQTSRLHRADAANPLLAVPQGEMGYFTSVASGMDLYLMHKSIRSKVFSVPDAPLKAEHYKTFTAELAPVNLR
jgi:hypothetical protein